MLGQEARRAVVRRYRGSLLFVIVLENWLLDQTSFHGCLYREVKVKCHHDTTSNPRTGTTTRTITTKSEPIKRLP